MVSNMKKTRSNMVLILFCSTILTGCFGSCGDWNCSGNPRWNEKVNDCYSRNLEVVKQQLGYKKYGGDIVRFHSEVQDSEIGQHISTQCIYHSGKYDIHKDKQYGHLFAK